MYLLTYLGCVVFQEFLSAHIWIGKSFEKQEKVDFKHVIKYEFSKHNSWNSAAWILFGYFYSLVSFNLLWIKNPSLVEKCWNVHNCVKLIKNPSDCFACFKAALFLTQIALKKDTGLARYERWNLITELKPIHRQSNLLYYFFKKPFQFVLCMFEFSGSLDVQSFWTFRIYLRLSQTVFTFLCIETLPYYDYGHVYIFNSLEFTEMSFLAIAFISHIPIGCVFLTPKKSLQCMATPFVDIPEYFNQRISDT